MADSTTNNGGTQGNDPNRTFSQEELDAIVADRLSRAKSKYADYADLQKKAKLYDELEQKNKSELEKANDKNSKLEKELERLKKTNEIRDIHEKVAKEKGVPASLLSGADEETCKKQADEILAFAKPKQYQGVGGHRSKTPPAGSAGDNASDFAELAHSLFGGNE